MKTRILTGISLASVLVFALIMRGWVFSCLWIAALCVALHELIYAFSKAGHRPVALPNWIMLLLGIPVFMLVQGVNSLILLSLMLFAAFFFVSIQVIFRSDPKLQDLLISILPMCMLLIPGLSMLGLLRIEDTYLSNMLMWIVFVIPTFGDAGAYFIGVKYGKTKLNPEVSPKKTVEGSLGGLVFSILGAMTVYAVFALMKANLPPWWHILLLAFTGSLVEQMGDLFASLIKRHCGIKDFGTIFPGHGGMIDRLDSVLFVAVLVFLYQVSFI
ncbi:MAG: phosphatidate cytidylyltransferase [Eubacteriales bacterium]|nr:phosphatidate cytidylyltransferase [Eubacteriales bacterium]